MPGHDGQLDLRFAEANLLASVRALERAEPGSHAAKVAKTRMIKAKEEVVRKRITVEDRAADAAQDN